MLPGGLESVLSQHAYLEPEGFGVADVAVGGPVDRLRAGTARLWR